jgi:predicted nucleic acid-binding protein
MSIFADTAGLAAYADRTQAAHVRAVECVRAVTDTGNHLITTNYVLAELAALLTRPLRIPREQQIVFFTALRSAAWIEVVHIDPALDAAAWQLWATRADKEWSLVDCASFVVMQDRGLSEALTSDHHFEQAGFVALLRRDAS